MKHLQWIAGCLADAILMDALRLEALRYRIAETLAEHPVWLDKFCRHILKKIANDPTLQCKTALVRIIVSYAPFVEACEQRKIAIRKIPLQKPASSKPLHPAVPALATLRELEHWLGLTSDELLWMQGHWKSHQHADQANHHYRYRWIDKADGSQRLLEIPKYHLKSLQKRIYLHILKTLPVHASAHGFCVGRSCLSHASQHVQQPMLIKFDLKDFFVSIKFSRVFRIFSALGYDTDIARLLTRLTTHSTPRSILDKGGRAHMMSHYSQPHLPQGAPSSPMLANLAAYYFDKRLQGLATHLGLHYSRYADDGALSGPQMSSAAINRLHATVAAIALEEGFTLNTRKTRVLGQGQQQRLTHIVVNQKINLPRQEYDQLKAILFNCVRNGPASQNHAMHVDFNAHLQGRIAYATQLNPGKAEKLRQLYEQIVWD